MPKKKIQTLITETRDKTAEILKWHNRCELYSYNTDNYINVNKTKKIRYHGPVVNTVPETISRVTTKKYDCANRTITTNISYINSDTKNRIINNIIPVHINSAYKDDGYYREQKRLLEQRYNQEMLNLDVERVYYKIINR